MATATEYFNTAGNYNWYAPHNVSNVVVEVIGAGGAGANRTTNGAGGGGAGGAYAKNNNFPAVAGTSYPIVVGQGGNTNNNAHGTDSKFNTTTVIAKGGNTANRNNATGQTPYADTSSTGDVRYRGGAGASGASNNGGGGGSSGGNNGNGLNGTGNNGGGNGSGTLPGGAGMGGNGAKTGSAVGSAGVFPGGAGGGATRNSTTNRAGGNGANGQVKITYDYTPNAVQLDGSTQYGTIANFNAIDNLTDWYIEGWFKRRTGMTAYTQYFALDNGTVKQINLVSENATDSDGLNFSQPYSTTDADGWLTGAIPQETWVHIGLRHSGSGLKYTTVIVNGRPILIYGGDYPHQGVGTIETIADGIIGIGAESGGTNKGKICVGGFFRVWNRWVNNAEIYKNYQKTLTAANETGLVVNCNFTEGSGATVDNEAGGNDLSLTGSPSWIAGPATSAKSYGTNTLKYFQVLESTAATPSGDDAEEGVTSHDTWIDSGDTEFLYDGATQQIVGVRFQNITVPQGATIVHAYLRLISNGDNTSGTCDVVLKCEDVDNSSVFSAGTNNSNISGRTSTTASVSWGIPSNANRELVSSPDIKDIIQEVTDRGGWVNGNALSILVTGSDTDVRNYFSADSFPYDLGWALEIEYVAPSVTEKSTTDSASGSDEASILVLVTTTDTGSGVDALSFLALLALSETSSGIDTFLVEAFLALTDSASGSDQEGVANIMGQTDDGAGSETVALLAEVPVIDTGSGVDVLDILVSMGLSESSSADDVLSILGLLDQSDSGNGDESVDVIPSVSVTDTGAGVDAINILAQLALSDDAIATEALSLLVMMSLTDSAVASDAADTLAILSETDSAIGSDVISILAQIVLTDSSSASEALEILASLALTETAVGVDVISLLAGVSETDSGTGIDSASLQAMIEISDTSAGTDAVVALAMIALSDSSVAVDALSILAEVAVSDTTQADDALAILVSFGLSDSAVSDDALSILADIGVIDSASSDELVEVSLNVGISDDGSADEIIELLAGVEIADIGSVIDELTLLIFVKKKIRRLADSARQLSQRVKRVKDNVRTLYSSDIIKLPNAKRRPKEF